ncbi:MAG TPA: YdeI/OmpD-associated family protein [Bauldia sp.]|nr:YdeI/OmpD-associated family protein [Bauldia sp.]
MSEPRFFKSQAEWRRWLEKHHATATEQLLGFHKVSSTRKGITRKEAVDEALCFGWIDGLTHRIDDHSWQVRFTPRRKRSVWSDINIRRIEELKAQGKVTSAGLAAYERRSPKLQKRYSSENRHVGLDPAYEKRFRANKAAWAWFEAKPKSYRQPAIWWVMSAAKEETRQRRLATLIADSEAGVTIKPLTPSAKRDRA